MGVSARSTGQLAEVSDPSCDRQGNCRATENIVLVEGLKVGKVLLLVVAV